MRKPMAKKVLAAAMVAAMTMSVAACGDKTPASTSTSTSTSTPEVSTSTVEEEVSPYTILKDKDGNTLDFGGIEVDFLDWWSPVDGSVAAPNSAYEEAVQEYREWLQSTYNFTFKQMKAYEWGDAPAFLQTYNETPDDRYLILIEREDPVTTAAVAAGFAKDLSSLPALDFSKDKFSNGIHTSWTTPNGVFAMAAGISEPRGGVFFNKKVLREAKINPDDIYAMVDNGTWTFDAFEELCAKVQRDTDGDDVIDVYAVCANWGNVYSYATFANGGSYIEVIDGQWTVTVGSDNTREALEFTQRLNQTYNAVEPEGAAWDYYKTNFTLGHVAFMPEDVYNGYPNGMLATEELADEEYGFVVFPKGPSADAKYTNLVSENLVMIPGIYDDAKANTIAQIWDLWTEAPKGYENFNGYLDNCRNGIFDEKALENVELMMTDGHKDSAVHGHLPGLDIGPEFLWTFWQPVSTVIENVTPIWQSYCDQANGK